MLLKFVKLAGFWFVHLPEYEGDPSDLTMVMGADVLCDMLDKDEDGLVEVFVTTKEDECTVPPYIIDFVNSTEGADGEQDGANYRMRDWKLDLWLCNVTKYVLGEFPATIYIQLT